jgi:hypothetical protein
LSFSQCGREAATIVDVTSCPGTDTCKLGIASSRGLACELRYSLGEKSIELDATVKNLRIKVSGCFNSCGQHHIADIGFYGINRNVKGFQVPHFQVILGGKFHDNAGEYGVAIGAVPSKRVPEAVLSITEFYLRQRQRDERFQEFVARVGKKAIKDLLEDLTKIPAHDVDRSYYSDWGDPREFTLADMGVAECALMRSALENFRKVERDPKLDGKFKLLGNEVLIAVNDRLAWPNTDESYGALAPEIEQLAKTLFGDAEIVLGRQPEERRKFAVRIKASRSFAVDELLVRLNSN